MIKTYLKRSLTIERNNRSCIILGPRRVGKSTLLRHEFSEAEYINLLYASVFFEYRQSPSLLRERYGNYSGIVVIDEVQLIPELMREVHALIEENSKIQFVLSGSSARKLRRAGNLTLGGRLVTKYLLPLTYIEMSKNFDLIKYLQYGGLPLSVLSDDPKTELQNYCGSYIKEEIQAERIVRHLDNFMSFLESAALMNRQLISYANIARDIGVTPKTVEEYFQILEDTLFGFRLQAFTLSKKRRSILTSKFYFFDCGVPNILLGRTLSTKTSEFGDAFEHFIVLEARAAMLYGNKIDKIEFWRSASGLEVDLLINRNIAVECKSGVVHDDDTKGLQALSEEIALKSKIIVSTETRTRKLTNGVVVMAWKEFVTRLQDCDFD